MSVAKDQAGNELKPVVALVHGRAPDGWPLELKPLRDTDEADITIPSERDFVIVWCSRATGMGSRTGAIAEIITTAEEREQQKIELDQAIAAAQRGLKELADENASKTEALRQLQRERDPARLERMVSEAVATRTTALEAAVAQLKATIVERDREIRELKESKRRLKEANDRLKGK